MTSKDTSSTVIETPYGLFQVVDSRRPKGDEVALLSAVDGSFTINKKTYTSPGGRMTLFRSQNGGWVNGGLLDLTDSAREKLLEAFTPIFDWFPPLTRKEKLAKIIESAVGSANSALDYEVFGAARKAINQAQDYSDTDQLNRAEIDQVETAVLDAVRAWLAAKEA